MTETMTRRGRQDRSAVRRRLLSWAVLAVLFVPAAGCNKFKSKQLIREGNAYFKEQLYEDALKKYEAAQRLDPNEVRLHKFVAMGNMALYNPGSQHPKDLEALKRSIDHFKIYLAARPEDEKAAKFLVTTYMNSQKYDDAIAYFKDWFGKHPKDSAAVQTIAMLYGKKNDFEQSMEWQKKRAALDSSNPEIYYTMGVTCWEKSYNYPGDALEAAKRRPILDFGMQNLERANQLRPDYFEAMLYVNLLYREYAKLETDPAKKDELKAKADEWQKKALEARKRVMQKQRDEQAKANPLEAM